MTTDGSEPSSKRFGIPRSYFLDRLPVQSDRATIEKIFARRPTTSQLELECASQDDIVDGILDRETCDDDGKSWRAQTQQRDEDLLVAGNLQANLKRALLMCKWLNREARKSSREVDWSRAHRLAAYEATELRNLYLLPSRWQELKDAIKPMGWRLSTNADEDNTTETTSSHRVSRKKRAMPGTRSKAGPKEKTDGDTIAAPQARSRNNRANAAAKSTIRRTTSARNALPASISNKIRDASPAGQVIPPLAQHPEQLLQRSRDAATPDVIEAAVRSASNLLAKRSVHSAGRIILVPLAVTMWTFHRAEGCSLAAIEERFGLLGGTKEDPLGSRNGETAEAKTSKVTTGSPAAVSGPIEAPTPANKQTVTGNTPSIAGAQRISSKLKGSITIKKRKRDEGAGQEGSEPVVMKKLKLLTGPRPDGMGAAMRAGSEDSGFQAHNDETRKDPEGAADSKAAEMELLAALIGEGYLDVQDLMVAFNDLNAKVGRVMKSLDDFHTLLEDLAAKREA